MRGLGRAVVVFIVLSGAARAEVLIDWVTVGNPGNLPNEARFGRVDYVYRMGKYEITNAQYSEFLNAVAATDTYNLYNQQVYFDPAMGEFEIVRSGEAGNYRYDVGVGWANRPVSNVSFWDAARFTNWLHNGQPTGAQDDTTTEDGAYPLHGVVGMEWVPFPHSRKPAAKVWIPSISEWHKAAYHKNDGPTGNYWLFPTGTDAIPSNDLIDPDPGNNANFQDPQGDFTIGSPYYLTEVGEFENSASPYGTFDQGGNVAEWTDTIFGGEEAWYLLPGSDHDGSAWMLSSDYASDGRSFERRRGFGFRVGGMIPEPGAFALLAVGAAFVFLWRIRTLRRRARPLRD